MGRKKLKAGPGPKQMLLSPNLKLKSPVKSKENEKEKEPAKRGRPVESKKEDKPIKKPVGRPKKNVEKVKARSPIRSPSKSPSKNRGRPKPQAKASAKLKSTPSKDCLDEMELEQAINNNNNNEKEKSPPLNNNNIDKIPPTPPSPANNNKKTRSPTPSPKKSPTPSPKKPNQETAQYKENEITPQDKENEITPQDKENEITSQHKENENVPKENNSQILLPERSTSAQKAVLASNKGYPNKQSEGENPNEVKCKVCKQWFPNRYFQRKHMLMEHEDQLYECRVCSFNSVDPEKLKSHIIKLHVTKKEKSETVSLDSLQGELEKLIDKKVPRKVMMEDGVTLGRDVNTKMRYVCALCNRIYTSKHSLERHVRCHTLEKPYHCDVCSFTSSYREHMLRHMTSVHLIVHSNAPKVKYVPKKRRSDQDDSKDEDVKEEDNGHEQVEGQEEMLVDGSGSSSPPKKRRNILRERFECAVCGLRATHKTDLVNHIRTKHPNAHIESLENNDGSKVHLIVTVAKKPKATKRLTIQCSYCLRIFHDTWKYKVHLRSHTGVKPFQCSLCDMRATSKMTVRDHIHRKHKQAEDAKIILRSVSIDGTVEEIKLPVPWREFKCETCNEQFNDNYNLKLHKQKNHLDTFTFFCLVCSHKEFTKAGMIIHCTTNHKDKDLDTIIMRNEKPCKVGPVNLPTCNFCNKIFAYQSQLNVHIKVHTGEKSFNCEHCDYKTNLKKYLENHLQKIHFGKDDDPVKVKRASKAKKKCLKDASKETSCLPKSKPLNVP